MLCVLWIGYIPRCLGYLSVAVLGLMHRHGRVTVVAVVRRMLLIQVFLLAWILWLLVVTRMSCSLTLGDWNSFSIHIGVVHVTRSVENIIG
jgi:hypothetical protein